MTVDDPRVTRTSTASGATDHAEATAVTATSVDSRRYVGVVVRLTRFARRAAGHTRTVVSWLARTVRPPGALVIVAATLGLVFGLVFGWVEWIVGGVAALLLFAASVPFLFGSRSYDVGLSLSRERVVAGEDLLGEVVVRNHGRRVALPGRIDIPVGQGLVEFGVPLLRAGHTVSQPLEIPRMRRGVVPIGPATTVRGDPVGLLRREHAFADVHTVFVHPRTVDLPSTSAGFVRDLEGSPTRRIVDDDMSFHAIRPYAPGDSRRHVHWRSTAKTGTLMVRQYEESRRSRMAVIWSVDDAEYLDADEFELAVSCAASLGLRAVRDAREVALVSGGEIPRAVKGRRREIRQLPAPSPRGMLDGFSAVRRYENTMPIVDVCRLTAETRERLSVAFVVVGSRVPLSSLQQAALAFSADTSVVAVICDERAHPRLQPMSALTVLTVGTVDDLSGLLLRGVTT